MSQLWTALKETFLQFWEERQERERLYLVSIAVVVVLLLIYLFGIDPALSGREQLQKSLPTLHLQAAEMQEMANALQALPGSENLNEVDREAILASLAKSTIKEQSLSVAQGVVRVQIASTSMPALQGWLLEMQKSYGLFVDEMKITALEEGMVSANFSLRQSTSTGG